MRGLSSSFSHVVVAAALAAALLAARPDWSTAQRPERAGGVRSLPDTLPRYAQVVQTSDSTALVRAVNDALQGRMGVEVPMRTTCYKRETNSVVITLVPVPAPGVVWRDLGGTVRILEDGRRIILSRE